MERVSLFLAAGDPSGDNAASRVVEHLKHLLPTIDLVGLGGPKLAALGQQQLAAADDLAVLGFWEVAKRYGYFRRLMHSCVDEIARRRPDAVVLVDYPGFNLRLAARVKRLGIPIYYYIAPQVWAWGRNRVKQMRRDLDRLFVILPFEPEFFNAHQIETDFVGHYLLEDIPTRFISSPSPGNLQLALLPGSRRQEVERMLPVMLETAAGYCRKHRARAVVAAIRGVYDYERAVAQVGESALSIVYDDSRQVVFDSDFVVTASGTATLETAIIGRPMVVVYRTGWITYQVARQLVRLNSIALANLVLGQSIVPELIQGGMTAPAINAKLDRYAADSDYRGSVTAALKSVPGRLGGEGASERVARRLVQLLAERQT